MSLNDQRHFGKSLNFAFHQISGRIHATKLILVSFCTFSRTSNSQIIEIIVAFLKLIFNVIQNHIVHSPALGAIACPRAIGGYFWAKMQMFRDL